MNRTNLTLLVAGGLAACGAATASDRATRQKPNILFILVDDLGLGDLSCQYATDLSTPNIDRIFEGGVRLDNFYANSNVSSPSRASLLTGRFPQEVGMPGVVRTEQDNTWGYLTPGARTMPEILGQNGYNTALVGKWNLGLESPNLPNEKGFDLFHGFLGDMMDDYYTHIRLGHNYMRLNNEEISPEGHATELFTRWGIDYLKQQAGENDPFFLYLAYNAPHSPLQAPVEWVEKAQKEHPELPLKRQRLIALVEHLDHNVGQVMDALRESGQLDNTLVVFTSDNGGDRGSMANNGPVRGAKGDMFEGGIRVACVVSQPGVFGGGRRVPNLVMMMDFLPTFCDLTGIRADAPVDGISVLDALHGKRQVTDNRYLYWMRYEGGRNFAFGEQPQTLVRYRNHKLLRNLPVEGEQMFDLGEDPLETMPMTLAGKTYEQLRKAMEEHARKVARVPFRAPVK